MKQNNKALSVSIMCADLLNLEKQIKIFEELQVDMIHVDVMDAHFVPNLTFCPDLINAMSKITQIPMDIHLMMTDPDVIIPSLNIREGDLITIHAELTPSKIRKNLLMIKDKGAKCGLALNPFTSVKAVKPYLNEIDLVLLMLVHPGFAGSTMVEGIMDKVSQLNQLLREQGNTSTLISVDGSVNLERATLMSKMGANVFVGGTAGVFKKDISLYETVPSFYSAIL